MSYWNNYTGKVLSEQGLHQVNELHKEAIASGQTQVGQVETQSKGLIWISVCRAGVVLETSHRK